MTGARQRLDQVLVARGIVQSRARAADLIARGAVCVDGRVAGKAGVLVAADARVEVDAEANAYVARSGTKLSAALRAFGFDPTGCVAIDIGASTGGFTQVLLEAGAKMVYAVDVGHDQLHQTLRGDPRVVCLEGVDARTLSREHIDVPVQAIVADVSFVSLKQALPVPLGFASAGTWLVALVKPQFEVGRAAIGKRGIVRDEAAQTMAVDGVVDFLEGEGWRVVGRMCSPLPGKEGNIEWLIGAVRDDA